MLTYNMMDRKHKNIIGMNHFKLQISAPRVEITLIQEGRSAPVQNPLHAAPHSKT
jgi:hypothetical protein